MKFIDNQRPQWTDEQVILFCEKYLTEKLTLLRDSRASVESRSISFQWLQDDRLSPFSFKWVSAICGCDHEDLRNAVVYELKHLNLYDELCALPIIDEDYEASPQMGLFFEQDGYEEIERTRSRSGKKNSQQTIPSATQSFLFSEVLS